MLVTHTPIGEINYSLTHSSSLLARRTGRGSRSTWTACLLLFSDAGSKAIAFAMSTVENDLMLDAKLKNHATLADDDNQLQCQDHAIPDDAPE